MNVLIAGVDEAGRGPLAGPVVAAAVILDPNKPVIGLADSKKLSIVKREQLAEAIKLNARCWCIAEASVAEIDTINILQATLLAMKRAVEGLSITPKKILVDGTYLPEVSISGEAIIKGDSKVDAISAASILAKVYRDQVMNDLQPLYPDYSFFIHKGYGTQQHLNEINRFGYTDIHRKSFNPIKAMIVKSEKLS